MYWYFKYGHKNRGLILFYVLVGNKCKHITVNKAERVVIISPPLENCLNFQLCCKLLKERNDH